MKNKLFADWGLKVISLLMAVALWYVVTNINDPDTTIRFNNVKVSMRNTGIVTDNGQVFEVLDDTDVVDVVTIRGPRSIIDTLSSENVSAIADFNNLTASNTVPINITTNKYFGQLESVSGNIDTLKLNIENLKSKTLALNATTSGTVSEGYMIGDVTADENQLRISGPESVIDQVVRAEANVSVTGFTQDIVTDADIVLLDAEGIPVEKDNITSNISKDRVRVEILQTKRVGLIFSTTGTPAEGYEATGTITSDPDTVLVAGRAAVINYLENIEIDEAINITGQTGDMQTLVNISKFLPSNLKIADSDFNGMVTVTVSIEPTMLRNIRMNVSDIELTNVPQGYSVTVVDPEESYSVSIRALQQRLDSLDPSSVKAVADLDDILDQEDTVGSNYHVTLDFYDDTGRLKADTPVQIWVTLIEE